MNETTKVLCERRSVRSFTDKQVPKDILDEILKCGCYAPSGMGMQSAVIVAIQDKDLIDKIAKLMPVLWEEMLILFMVPLL